MNEEIDESDFYHQDFTTASQWEIFIARMEEIINQWRTDDSIADSPEEIQKTWQIRSEKLHFADVEFCLHSIRKPAETAQAPENTEETDKQNEIPIEPKHDFELFHESKDFEHSCLHTWYGVSDYIVLAPANNFDITSTGKIKILLSSASIVANNLKCGKPIFVQIREKWQKCYLGVYENEEIRINFEMVHLKYISNQYKFLSGLVDLFKKKIMSPVELDTIFVSLQHTYALHDFGRFYWKQDLMAGENFDVESVFILPFGVTVDPINTMFLKTTWNRMPNFSVMEYEHLTYFHAIGAHKWSCMVKMTNDPVCLMGDSLTEFLQILGNNSTVYDVLGDFAALPAIENNPFDVLTEPAVPTISALLTRVARRSISRNKRNNNPPISETVLVPILYFMFPDADENSSFPYGVKEDKDVQEGHFSHEMFKNLEEEFKSFKTCGNDSLIWRLSIVLAHSLQSLGGLRAFTHIWYEFVQEMRYRWEKSMPIPGLAPGFPDLRTCLLNQKLQMLNSCIDRKISCENRQQSKYDSAEEDSSTDDEFFDCSEKPVEEIRKRVKHSLWNQPVGRLSKFGDLKLLKTGDPLYIPITQDPVLKTEDQLEEDTDVLLKLGSDAEATELRARIMSASLLSDMESFKAANPGSVVEDFIRWYSPRDWIEEEETDEWGQKKGHLSPRMMIEENNIWVQMWTSAKPVPACRQKRLFDDTREAEKVLQFLELRTVSQIAELIVPVLSHAAIYRLVEECRFIAAELSESAVNFPSLLRQGARLSRELKLPPRRFEAFIQEMSALELLISQINSLHYKLNPSGAADPVITLAVTNLVVGREVEIDGKRESPVGGRILSMFVDAGLVVKESAEEGATRAVRHVFQAPVERDFVLRTNAVRPARYSAKCPQFLRAISSNSENRLAGAFSEDIVFF